MPCSRAGLYARRAQVGDHRVVLERMNACARPSGTYTARKSTGSRRTASHAPERRRADPDVDHDIEQRAPRAVHVLRLAGRHVREVQAAHAPRAGTRCGCVCASRSGWPTAARNASSWNGQTNSPRSSGNTRGVNSNAPGTASSRTSMCRTVLAPPQPAARRTCHTVGHRSVRGCPPTIGGWPTGRRRQASIPPDRCPTTPRSAGLPAWLPASAR